MPEDKPEVVEAHTQTETFQFKMYYPDHAPRASDPHYNIFNQTRDRLEKLGKLICWRCGSTENCELHHSQVEYALANGVDIEKFSHKFPELHITDDASFIQYVESEGNLLCLCMECHRGNTGIHNLVYPQWIAFAWWKDNLPKPAERIKHDSKSTTDT